MLLTMQICSSGNAGRHIAQLPLSLLIANAQSELPWHTAAGRRLIENVARYIPRSVNLPFVGSFWSVDVVAEV